MFVKGEDFSLIEKNDRYYIGEIVKEIFCDKELIDVYRSNCIDDNRDYDCFEHNIYDVSADVIQDKIFTSFGCSIRGRSHFETSSPRQDAFRIRKCVLSDGNPVVVCGVSDGVSNAILSHQISEFLVDRSVNYMENLFIKNEIIDFEQVNSSVIESISKYIYIASVKYCVKNEYNREESERILSDGSLIREEVRKLRNKWATTLHLIMFNPLDGQYIYIRFAGDGACYIIDETQGWYLLDRNKGSSDGLIDNSVIAYPDYPGVPFFCKGVLDVRQNILLVTDGYGDDIKNGDTAVGGFLHSKLLSCTNLVQYIKIMSYGKKYSSDDKTGILIRRNTNDKV